MEPKKPRQGELQSKTVILPETDQAEKTLDTLARRDPQVVPSKKSPDWLTIVIIALLILVAVEVLWILLH